MVRRARSLAFTERVATRKYARYRRTLDQSHPPSPCYHHGYRMKQTVAGMAAKPRQLGNQSLALREWTRRFVLPAVRTLWSTGFRTYLPTYLSTLLYARGSTESSHSHLTRANLCSELQRKRYRPICCERAFELATSEWHGSADDTTIPIPFHRFRSMPSLRSDRWRLWLTGLYAKTHFLSRTYAVKIAARHLHALCSITIIAAILH